MDQSHPLEFLVSALADVSEAEEAVDKLVAVAVETVGTSFGGITLIHDEGKRFETVGATDQSVVDADHLQYELREGPCVDAALTSKSLTSLNLGDDPRWPTWGPQVSALGFHSVLSSEIHGRGRRMGALNLYGATETAFDDKDFEIAQMFAKQASLVLGYVLHETELMHALETRTVIGQAQGILMQRFKISSATAFALLRRHSMDNNTRVRDLADYIIETRDLPSDERASDDP